MSFYIAAIIALFSGLFLLLLSYIKVAIDIQLFEQDDSQGIKLNVQIPFYEFSKFYDYSDPQLNLVETVIVDRINTRLHDKLGFNLEGWQSLISRIPDFVRISEYERSMMRYLNMAARLTVVENLRWKTTVGGCDAMQTALYAGLLWAIKGWAAALVSTHSRLKHLDIGVKPDFVNNIYLSKITCILKMRLVHIITITISILVWKVRWWYKWKRSRNKTAPVPLKG